MEPKLLPNGRILIPKRVSSHGIVADGWVEIGPEDPDYEKWKAELDRIKSKTPKNSKTGGP